MSTLIFEKITIETIIDNPIDLVWEYFTNPIHIVKWNHASNDWHTTYATNTLKIGGHFLYKMEAKDKSHGFDFEGVYISINKKEFIAYKLSDGRTVEISFINLNRQTKITEVFDAEFINPIELQQGGWQSILDNFKNYAELN